MKRVLFLVLALLWSVAPVAMAQKQTFTGSWSWMWPDASMRQIYPNIHAMAVDSAGNIYASVVVGDTSDGLYISRDNGQTFSKVPASAFGNKLGLNGAYMIRAIYIDSGSVLVTASQYIFCSSDAGRTWGQVLYDPNEGYGAITLIGDTLFAGGSNGIYRSTDGGNSWTNVDTNDVTSRFTKKFNYVTCFAVTADGNILAGTGSGIGTWSFGILRSTDGGNSWSYANNGITSVTPDTVDWNAYITSMATVGNAVFASSTHLYRSMNDGESWQVVGDNIFANQISGAIIPCKLGLIVPTLNSLWLTTDQGNTWHDLIDFSQAIYVWSSAQWMKDSTVLVGMWNGLGLLTINAQATAIAGYPAVPCQFGLSQNYPNPFNPSTRIDYSVSRPTFVNLSVYNILGQRVATLVDEMKYPGNYTAEFSGFLLPSGVYFCCLMAGAFFQIRKMILMK